MAFSDQGRGGDREGGGLAEASSPIAPSRTHTAAPSAYAAAIVNYNSYDDVDRCLASLRRQTLLPVVTVVVDADPEPLRQRWLAARHPATQFLSVPNCGYAGGANLALAALDERAPGAVYALLLNPDVEVDPGFAAELSSAMEARPRVALAGGKLWRPGREHIDSAGIELPAHRRPRDRGSEELDRGLYEREELVFGISGAALWLRRAALPELALAGEVFDEDFFVYHEDTDLAWRARRLGWEVLFVPRASAEHRRGWRRDRRFEVAASVRRHSFKNHYLQMLKNERVGDLLLRLPVLLAWEGARLGFALLRDRELLSAYAEALALAPRAWRKRRELVSRVREQRRAARSAAASRWAAAR